MEEWTSGETKESTFVCLFVFLSSSRTNIYRVTTRRLIPQHAREQFFIDFYNKKFPENTLDEDKVAMKRKGCATVADTDIISECFEAYDDLYVVTETKKESKESSSKEEEDSTSSNIGLVRCRNYGCQAMFDPMDNMPTACKHHVAPPIFHDTKKGWSCCKHKMVYDWSEFETIEGCTTGPHSTEDPKLKFAASPTVAIAAKSNERHAQKLKTVEDFERENPDAVSAASSLRKMMQDAKSRPVQKDSEGRIKCVRKGCGVYFFPHENNDKACHYHPKQPVFHDTKKFYSCCSDKVAYEFDEFLKIKGCTVGCHTGTME